MDEKQKKKFMTKLKKMLGTINKYNVSCICGIQFAIEAGTNNIEIILTHRSFENLDILKILRVSSCDEFSLDVYTDKDESKEYGTDYDKSNPPVNIVLATCDINSLYDETKYIYSRAYIIFPKIFYNMIRNEELKDISFNIDGSVNFNIDSIENYTKVIFSNTKKLNFIFGLQLFPDSNNTNRFFKFINNLNWYEKYAQFEDETLKTMIKEDEIGVIPVKNSDGSKTMQMYRYEYIKINPTILETYCREVSDDGLIKECVLKYNSKDIFSYCIYRYLDI